MAFVHARYMYLGFIYGWDAKCEATEDWVEYMRVEALPRGRNQPFYNVICNDGRNRYVAEDNICPVAFTKEQVQVFFRICDEFSVYFDGGVDFPSEPHRDRNIEHVGARGRLHMNPQTHYAYPDDEAVALRWIKLGVFS